MSCWLDDFIINGHQLVSNDIIIKFLNKLKSLLSYLFAQARVGKKQIDFLGYFYRIFRIVQIKRMTTACFWKAPPKGSNDRCFRIKCFDNRYPKAFKKRWIDKNVCQLIDNCQLFI